MTDASFKEQPASAASLVSATSMHACAPGEAPVDAGKLLALVVDIFKRANMPDDEADLVADALVLADLRQLRPLQQARIAVQPVARHRGIPGCNSIHQIQGGVSRD